MKRLLVASLVTTATLSFGAAAIAQSSTPTTVAHTTGPRIVIQNFAFSGTFRVHPGQRVKVVNKDAVVHTLTSNIRGKFNTGSIPANGGSRTFTAPRRLGRYGFHCTVHPEMTGTLRVVPRRG